MVEIVTVDRPDVIEAELLEQRAAGQHAARVFLGAPRRLFDELRQLVGHLFAEFAQGPVGLAGDEPRQIGRHGADRRRDRHLVVVEDDDQPFVAGAGVVHGLVGHASRHRAVADHGDDVVLLAGEIARYRHAEAGGDRGRGMRGAERVVFALRALGEAGQPAALADGAHAVAPAGEDLVRIGLVADVPDQAIIGGVEHVVQRDGQFHDAEAGAEMAAGLGDGVDHLRAHFVGELPELLGREVLQVGWNVDTVEQRRFRRFVQSTLRKWASRMAKVSRVKHGAPTRVAAPVGIPPWNLTSITIEKAVWAIPWQQRCYFRGWGLPRDILRGRRRGARRPGGCTGRPRLSLRRAARCRSACRRRRG